MLGKGNLGLGKGKEQFKPMFWFPFTGTAACLEKFGSGLKEAKVNSNFLISVFQIFFFALFQIFAKSSTIFSFALPETRNKEEKSLFGSSIYLMNFSSSVF